MKKEPRKLVKTEMVCYSSNPPLSLELDRVKLSIKSRAHKEIYERNSSTLDFEWQELCKLVRGDLVYGDIHNIIVMSEEKRLVCVCNAREKWGGNRGQNRYLVPSRR